MNEKMFYGIWAEVPEMPAQPKHWVKLSNDMGFFTEHLCIVRGNFHNIRKNLSYCWDRVSYQVYQVGQDGLPMGEPLNE